MPSSDSLFSIKLYFFVFFPGNPNDAQARLSAITSSSLQDIVFLQIPQEEILLSGDSGSPLLLRLHSRLQGVIGLARGAYQHQDRSWSGFATHFCSPGVKHLLEEATAQYGAYGIYEKDISDHTHGSFPALEIIQGILEAFEPIISFLGEDFSF